MKVVSYSLWGNDPKYYIGAVKNIVQHIGGAYIDWKFRFYCDSLVPKPIVNTLEAFGAEVIVSNIIGDWKFAVERFKVIDDPNVEYSIFRDCDSRLSIREIRAVQEWLGSGKKLHVMRDHPYHGNFPILAGMWGIKKDALGELINPLLDQYEKESEAHYFYDQNFLATRVWPKLQDCCLEHDEFFKRKPFPTDRMYQRFVGQSFDEFDNPNYSHIEALEGAEKSIL